MNHTTLLVKILTKPTQTFAKDNINITEFIGKFYQYRDNKFTICKVTIWGRLGYDLEEFYKVNDYAIVEGQILVRESLCKELNRKAKIEISAFKSYPLILNPRKIKK